MQRQVLILAAAWAVACGGGKRDEPPAVDDAAAPIDAAIRSFVDVEPGPIDAIAFGATARTVVVTAGGAAAAYDIVTGTRAGTGDGAPDVSTGDLPWPEATAVAVSRDGTALAVAYADGRIRVIDRASAAAPLIAARVVTAAGPVDAIAVTDGGLQVFTATGPQVTLWSTADGRSLRTMRVDAGGFAVSAAGNALATVLSGQIVVRHVPGGSVSLRVPDAANAVYALSPDGGVLAVAAGDGRVALHATNIGPPAAVPEPPVARHWTDELAGVDDGARAALRAWETSALDGRRAAFADASATAGSAGLRVTATEYALDARRGAASRIALVVDAEVRDVQRREASWRGFALEVTGARCLAGPPVICHATATNTGGVAVPLEVSVFDGDVELVHGAAASPLDAGATVDLAVRAAAPTRGRTLAVCVYALARTGGVACADVAVN